MIDKLIEARKKWNQLNDAIYAIGNGDLDNSHFNIIYNNFEAAILEMLINEFPEHEEFLIEYFTSIILDFAQIGYATLETETTQITLLNGKQLYYFLSTYKENIQYKEMC